MHGSTSAVAEKQPTRLSWQEPLVGDVRLFQNEGPVCGAALSTANGRNGRLADGPDLAVSGMTAFGTVTLQSCHWLRLRGAGSRRLPFREVLGASV